MATNATCKSKYVCMYVLRNLNMILCIYVCMYDVCTTYVTAEGCMYVYMGKLPGVVLEGSGRHWL